VQQAQRRAARGVAERGGESAQVPIGERHHAGVQRGRAGALVLAELRVDLARDRHVSEVRLEHPPERLLVRRIGVGVEQAHRDRLHALRPQGGDDTPSSPGASGSHGAVRPHLLGDLEAGGAALAAPAGAGSSEAIEMRAVHARDLEHVAEAARGDEAHRATRPLHDGIGDGGAVASEA
jgi:hypothetical protein